MSEYIEREKLKNILEAKAEMAIGTPKEIFYNVVKMLEFIPTVDVVEVVRCRNCKNLESCTMKVRKLSSVSKDRVYFETDLDHFCSYGVRKEE